tara:strand:- start:330 stop:563 length:234 start_codon:yes stop_codon:yes gene_type:complete
MVVELTDFRLAGYLIAKGAKFLGTTKNDRREVVFSFDDSAGEATQLLTEYPTSLEQRYDASCKTMYDLVKVELKKRG